MKRLIIAVAALLSCAYVAQAQQLQVLPNDPAVRQGKLENGMTYYIRHNDKPEKRAEFYLATNVGAIQETPDQDGLAHFLEHMCFNGTKNFPGKALLNYLESIGASFGGNINAGTGVEQTQYMLNNIPILREGVVDTCLLIMHDYSHFVTCDPEEIDKERGVIVEEWRSRRTSDWRMHEKSLPYYYGDSKYGSCTLIGSKENLENFKPESLVNFYQTWYRPDLQALVVVGDVDVDQVEAKIKTVFADIPAPVNPKPKDVIRIPDNVEPMVGVITDPEATNSSFELLWKSEARPLEYNNTVQGEMLDLLSNIVSTIMNERFQDIASKPGSPFLGAQMGIGDVCATMEAVQGQVSVKDDNILPGLAAFLAETEKMKRFGFTDAEVERAKTEILSVYETVANRADTRKNANFISPIISNFFFNYAFMEPQAEYELVQMILPQLQTAVVNSVASQLITDENLVVLFKGPEKEGAQTPAEAQILEVINAVRNSEFEAPSEEQIESEFIDPSTLVGSKVKKTKASMFGATEWTLKNGVKVILLPTDYEKDKISFTIYREGGSSLIETEDLYSFESNLWSLFTNYNGVSRFPATTVTKMLSGKQLSVSQRIASLENGVTGTTTTKDLETALQLAYLYYTDPRFDADAFAQAEQNLRAILPNYVNQPDYKLQKTVVETAFGNNRRKVLISEEVLDKASLEAMEKVVRSLYKDAAGATMIMVGDFDPDTVKPLVEKYVGSLPKGKKAPSWIDRNEDVLKDNILNDFKVAMQTPKATEIQVLRADDKYTTEKSVSYQALEYVLNMLYTETIREDEGGTYGVGVSASFSRIPKEVVLLQISFETNPESVDRLREKVSAGLRGIAENGPTAEQFDKTLNNLKKNIPERKITNSYWLGSLKDWNDYGEDTVASYEKAVETLTPEKIRDAAAKLVNDGNLIEIVMRPEESADNK